MKDSSTSTTTRTRALPSWSACGVLALAALVGSGSSSYAADLYSQAAVAAMSPAAEVVQPFDAVRLGMEYVADHAGTDFLVGRGDSMLPLYRDHTVVVTQRIAMSGLRAGMTAVYIGESGRPVAHVLVRKTFGGWITMGVGNASCDSTRVTQDNLLGVVVKAFEPTKSPMLALLDEATRQSSVALAR